MDLTVLFVGAGLSGLSAARRRHTDRVGGRTVSKDLPAANGVDQWDMGGKWVSSSQTHVTELIREVGLEVFPQYTEGKKVHHVGGPHAKIKTYITRILSYSPSPCWTSPRFCIDHLTQNISVEDPMSSSNAELYDGMMLHTFMEKHICTTQVKEELALCSHIVFGLEASEVSFLFLLMYSAPAGGTLRLLETTPGSGQEFRVKGGTQQLSEKQDSENMKVTTSAGTVTCKAVIVACPSHLAEPALPAEHQRLTQCLHVGHMTKLIITHPTVRKGFSWEIVARPSEDCPLSVTFDATSPRGNPALVGFITGVQACDWCDRKMEERRDAVISSLVKYLGPEASTYIHDEEKDWAKEEWSGGCPVNVMTPGMLMYYHPSLRKPFGRYTTPLHYDTRKGSKCKSSKCYLLFGLVMTAAALVMAHLLAKPELGF
uniref:monoamine oxidase n=1 Tax=Cyprinus carpio carpio TaxID=630221 RepID=A0A8C1AGK4_CYPCA